MANIYKENPLVKVVMLKGQDGEEKLINQADGSGLCLWVGTQAEYDAIPEEELIENCLYYITDDTRDDFRTDLNALDTKIDNVVTSMWDRIYPVGSFYISMNATSPATLFGGTWTQVGGRMLLGVGAGEANNDDFYGTYDGTGIAQESGKLAGEPWHTLTVEEMPRHIHGSIYEINPATALESKLAPHTSGDGFNFTDETMPYAGGDEAHNNMPPFISVYMWYRTA